MNKLGLACAKGREFFPANAEGGVAVQGMLLLPGVPGETEHGAGRVSSGACVFQATRCGEILSRSQVLDDFDPCGEA